MASHTNEIKEGLRAIGWKVIDIGGGHSRVIKFNGIATPWYLFKNRLFYEERSATKHLIMNVVFLLDKCRISCNENFVKVSNIHDGSWTTFNKKGFRK